MMMKQTYIKPKSIYCILLPQKRHFHTFRFVTKLHMAPTYYILTPHENILPYIYMAILRKGDPRTWHHNRQKTFKLILFAYGIEISSNALIEYLYTLILNAPPKISTIGTYSIILVPNGPISACITGPS